MKHFLPVSKTSTITEAMSVLPTSVSKTGITLPGHSEVSQAATTPCRLQLCSVAQLASKQASKQASKLTSVLILPRPVINKVLYCM
jgi:hypothetical protein